MTLTDHQKKLCLTFYMIEGMMDDSFFNLTINMIVDYKFALNCIKSSPTENDKYHLKILTSIAHQVSIDKILEDLEND